MNGMAGTGKTTVAASFSKTLDSQKQLAASFFCTVASPECRQVKRIVPSIAYQLARYSIPFQRALYQVLGNDPNLPSKNISKQFEQLLKEPLVKVEAAIPNNLVVVIDALDECDDKNGVELLLDMIFKYINTIPLKFFITSRPKPDIYNKMLSYLSGTQTTFHLHNIENSLVQADIETYLKLELFYISPTEEQIGVLAQKLGNLFIYAATLIRYIRFGKRSANPHKRLKSALEMISKQNNMHTEIDSLYLSVLDSVIDEDGLDEEEVEDLRLVLHTILCAQEPISIRTLCMLSGLDDSERVSFALQPVRSVIHFSESTQLISILHASFQDFMFDKARSRRFFCDIAHHNQILVQHCFETMKNELKFNICNLETSFIPDQSIDDIKTRIKRCISSELYYACRYWGEHLQCTSHIAQSIKLRDMLGQFLSTRLLFWMEVMNLNLVMSMGAEILLKVILWLRQGSGTSSELDWFAEDSRNFVNSFAANPVSQSTPHIYISMLPFCPKSTSVSQHYWGRMRGLIDAKGSGMQYREAAALATWKVGSGVHSVAYSPDGTRVAFGCTNGTLGIRNVYDGYIIVGPIEGHTACVTSVDFSPDGMRVASGSKDSTIRIWNAQDGTPATEPIACNSREVNSLAFSADSSLIVAGYQNHCIEVWSVCLPTPVSITGSLVGHTGPIRSVAFSPYGDRVASGSNDHTIRIWDIDKPNGAYTNKIIEGHTGSVESVAFSSDGKYLASGSGDRTVRIWNVLDGEPVINPIEGHRSRVTSISFSPDDKYIASCSCDQAIRVWNIRDGTLVDGLFEGHTGYIFCVRFSPDGTRMASGSEDCTIRLWNISETGLIIPPSAGHTHRINSVAISPDNSHIATASSDFTLIIWDMRGNKVTQTLREGHNDIVWSVAFSLDGGRIASGSSDRTVRLWDVYDNRCLKTFEGHSDVVYAVSFSPNGKSVISASSDCTIRVWDALSGALVLDPIRSYNGSITSMALSADGLLIASGSSDSTIQVWGAEDGKLIWGPSSGHGDAITSVTFSPDSEMILSTSRDCTARLWNTHNGNLLGTTLEGHANRVTSATFSPDGTYIATTSDDCTVKVWMVNGTHIRTFYGHTDSVRSVAFSPDGSQVVSASWDQYIRLWNTGKLLKDTAKYGEFIGFKAFYANKNRSPSNEKGGWTIREDGWVISGTELLFWVPSEVLRSLITEYCTHAIGRSGTIMVDLTGAFIGERWHECYITSK
ncbi:putative WD repeat-containing protein alr3466 OS=Nostoc sp, (strain PCC 7120 / UTEX 2576) GN=alr3466 PE=4 SV=1 [Rhizoctonia solani AG-1 IB]|uniref:Putative WD repeat-containing protein alr3466 n=1 Tax=Thanatephorus cucumeris (strain AG1-IB / isolate 7/3/14) TaxID=1108050 RepID=A0A0B7FKX5_THACB|nr:putative WD repeat-containing protein alr3466 OS=Nostoc sp, (strain PCC 7120 / UTEX 2576) GN=alr3466 PE=4 SV=1 [Rhizoctonia solani AG-1 IB]